MIMSLKMALRSIGSNKLRAVLTMLGIIIGVMALVVLVSLVEGATQSVTDRISDLGTNYVEAHSWDFNDGPDLQELEEWAESEPLVENLAVYDTYGATVKFGTKTEENAEVIGCSPSYYDVQGMQLAVGRFIKNVDMQNASRVCVLSPPIANSMVGYTDCVGEEITINGLRYTIVGVLGDSESLLYSGYNAIYIPYNTLIGQFQNASTVVNAFYVTAPEGTVMSELEDVVYNYLEERVGYDDWGYENFYVYAQDVMEGAMDDVYSALSILLGCIASISLIVGGIGIMNIMLVTVTERTQEIGIRKAIGANRGTILRQFLLEAVVLCMMGCLVGIFLSWGILRLANVVVADAGITFSLSGGVVLLSVVFCFVIGVIFGLYPANKAAKMKPIDALHYGG